jgi:predicted nucleotidyltransferase
MTTTENEAEETFRSVLSDAVEAIEQEEIPYVLIGGLATAAYGRPRPTKDVDFLVRLDDTDRTIKALEKAGFESEDPDEEWLHKAFKNDILVDVIHRIGDSIYLTDEMLERASARSLKGTDVVLVPPEDFVVMEAVTHSEETPQYWYNALNTIAHVELDWDYLLARAKEGPRRVLSLLLYAQSNDLVVPDRVVRRLFETVFGG